MKKIILSLVVAALAATSAFAQFSIGAGYANSTFSTKVNDNTTKSDPINGFYGGVDYSIALSDIFKVTPGLYFSMMTDKGEYNVGSLVNTSSKKTEMYLDIPVNFSASMPLGSSVKGFLYAGPTFSLGCLSQVKVDVDTVAGGTSNTVD